MEKISVRQLTREFKSVIKLLPVIITDNGKDKYILKELSDNQVSDKPVRQVKVSDSKRLSDIPKEIAVSDSTTEDQLLANRPLRNMEFCTKHKNTRKISCGCR